MSNPDEGNVEKIATIAAVTIVSGLLYSWLNSSDRKTEVIDNFQKCVKAVKIIRKHCKGNPVLGFDCEWVNESNVSLLQLCTHKGYCALIRLCNLPQVPNSLCELLSDPKVIKVGVGVKRDAQLLAYSNLHIVSTLDLRFIAVLTGAAKPRKLSSIYDEVMGKSLSKTPVIYLSNWDAFTLTKEQIEYAAEDAIAGMELYMKLAERFSDVKIFQNFFDKHYDPYYHDRLMPLPKKQCNLL